MIYLPLLATLFFLAPAISAVAILRSLSLGWHLVLLGICIFYGASPLLIVWAGMGLAKNFNCLAEAVVFTCPNPPWLGGVITYMVFAHWLAIVTIPSAILGCLGLLISVILKTNPSLLNLNSAGTPIANFHRSRRHRAIAGVCAAIAQQWSLPVLGVRIITVILAIVIPGVLPIIYLWFWLAFPLESLSYSP